VGLRAFGALRDSEGDAAKDRGPTVRSNPDEWEELRREIARCRRFARSFALVRITGGTVVPGTVVPLGPYLRSIDHEWAAGDVRYVLLPEAGCAAAQAFVERLRRDATEALEGASASVAAFPEDGVTTGALLKTLRKRAGHRARGRSSSSARIAESPVHA